MRELYLFVVWVHVLAAVLWVGGMLFLVAVVVPLLRTPPLRAQALVLLQGVGLRFRAVGWAALLVLVASGAAAASFRAGSPAALANAAWWASRFGRLLALKLGIVGLVLALAVVHDFGVGPRATTVLEVAPGSPQAERWRAAARWMGRINLLLALVVVALAVALVRGGF